VNGCVPRITLGLRNNPTPIEHHAKPASPKGGKGGAQPTAHQAPVLLLRPQPQSCGTRSTSSTSTEGSTPQKADTVKPATPHESQGLAIDLISGIKMPLVDEQTTEEKVTHLHEVFPQISRTRCGHILQIEEGDMESAFAELYKEAGDLLFSEGIVEEALDDDDDFSDSEHEGLGNDRGKGKGKAPETHSTSDFGQILSQKRRAQGEVCLSSYFRREAGCNQSLD